MCIRDSDRSRCGAMIRNLERWIDGACAQQGVYHDQRHAARQVVTRRAAPVMHYSDFFEDIDHTGKFENHQHQEHRADQRERAFAGRQAVESAVELGEFLVAERCYP